MIGGVFTEADPVFGKDLHTPGAKADAGKLRPGLILNDMVDALIAVVKVADDGAKKYSPGGWKLVEDGFSRYEEAGSRHFFKRLLGDDIDPDSGALHLAHEAWCALAKLQLFLDSNPTHKVKL